jgi:uncharacterized membrane protein
VSPVLSSAETERLAKDLLDRARAETPQADNKASILLAGVLAAVGGTAAAVGAGKWNPVHHPWYVSVPFWGAIAAVVAAIVCLAAAIYPRGRVQPGQRPGDVTFFGDVAALDSVEQLRELLTAPGTQLVDVWIDQIWQISMVVNRKYLFLRRAVRLLGVALPLAVIVLIAAAA